MSVIVWISNLIYEIFLWLFLEKYLQKGTRGPRIQVLHLHALFVPLHNANLGKVHSLTCDLEVIQIKITLPGF